MEKALKILVIDNTREVGSYGSKNIVHWVTKMSPRGTEVMVRRAPDMDIPSDLKFDAIVLSGSVTSCMELSEEWIAPYDQFVTQHIKAGTPILGICYGHQTLARCLMRLSGKAPALGKATDAEFGWVEIERVGESRLLDGLEPQFITYESHYEVVTEVPPGTRVTAKTARCAIQAFELEDKPVFGIQFHPEYSIDEAEASLASKLKNGVRKDWIINAGKGSKLYNENIGKGIFGNFFKIAFRN